MSQKLLEMLYPFPLGLECRWQRDEVGGRAALFMLWFRQPWAGHQLRNRWAVQKGRTGVRVELSHLSSSHQGQDQLRLQCRRRTGAVLQLHRGRNEMSIFNIVLLVSLFIVPPSDTTHWYIVVELQGNTSGCSPGFIDYSTKQKLRFGKMSIY